MAAGFALGVILYSLSAILWSRTGKQCSMTLPLFHGPQKPLFQFVSNPLPICAICNAAVALETAKTDEDGAAIHEPCYVLKMKSRERALPNPTQENQTSSA